MKQQPWLYFPVFLMLLLTFNGKTDAGDEFISLEGKWSFALDSSDTGINDKWFGKGLPETIILPGSMITNGKGFIPDLKTNWTGSIYDSSWFFNPRMEKYRQPGNIKFPFSFHRIIKNY